MCNQHALLTSVLIFPFLKSRNDKLNLKFFRKAQPLLLLLISDIISYRPLWLATIIYCCCVLIIPCRCAGCGYNSFLPAICCLLCIFCSISRKRHLWVHSNWCLFLPGECIRNEVACNFWCKHSIPVSLVTSCHLLTLAFRLYVCSYSMLDAQQLILLILGFSLKLTSQRPINHTTK